MRLPTRRLRGALLGLAAAASLACSRATPGPPFDLVIRDVAVFDTTTGQVRLDRTVVIQGGRIAEMGDQVNPPRPARRIIEGRDRLLTPGIVDVHHHTSYLLGDSITPGGGFVARLSMDSDSIAAYRRRFAESYLPYGITTVRDAGSDERQLPMLVAWMERSPDAPDFHPVGGALVSHEEDRVPYVGHAVVADPDQARRKVQAYHDAGLRHVKLYWRLREPEFVAALEAARGLGMNVTGHIDFKVLEFERALDLGLRSFEHAYTVVVGALTDEEFARAWEEVLPGIVGDRQEGRFYLGVMAYMHLLGANDPEMRRLIARLAETDSTVVPTLHIFAQRFGLAAHATAPFAAFDDLTWLSEEQRAWAIEGYRTLAGYVREMHEAGIPLAVGTDWAEPGEAALSEMLLLHDAGIPIAEVLSIATLGGAQAIGVDDEIGRIEPGMRANLILFDASPLENPRALLGPKVVVKDGVVWEDP